MAQPWKHPQSGVFYFRREVPADIRTVIGKREWKVSLKTRNLSEARPRFASESVACEEAFALAREQAAGRPKDFRPDAPKLADRWAKAAMEAWDTNPEEMRDFLNENPDAHSHTEHGYEQPDLTPASDLHDGSALRSREQVVSGFISETLRAWGYPPLSGNHPSWSTLVDAFYGRWCDVCRVASERHIGNWRSTLPLPALDKPLALEVERQRAPIKAPKLTAIYSSWADEKRQTSGDNRSTQKTVAEFGSTVTRFVELHGDLPVDRITRAICQEFRSSLGKVPTKGEGVRGLTAPELIAKAEAEGLPTASLATVRKQLRALSAILGFAVQLGHCQENPVIASGMIQRIAKAEQKQRNIDDEDKGYSRSELVTIFTSPLYTKGWQPPKADFGRAFYWLPLLMVYTGARREELAQLEVADINKDETSGTWYLAICPGEDKTVKTASSRRKVPLHPDLLALGLLEYKDSLPANGRLFPKLHKHSAHGYGYAFGKLWGKYLREVVGLESQASPSHGFRHAFKTLCREVDIPDTVSDWITGHSPPNVGASYGSNPLSRMARELEKLPSISREAGLL